jgi:hypothetical protein
MAGLSIDKYKGRINDFLFGPVNPLYASIFRICLSLIIIIVFLLPHAKVGFYLITDHAYDSLYQKIFLTRAYLIISFVISILFGVGYYPRLFGFILSVLLFPLIFIFGYHVSRQILLFTLIAFSTVQSDIRLSIRKNSSKINSDSGPIWPIRLIQIQLSVLYGINAIAKTYPEYLSGKVLEGMSMVAPNFLVNLSDGYLHIGTLAIPVFLLAISSALTEYILAIGFWFRRTRIPTAILGLTFHLVLMKIMTIGFLDWAAMFLYLAFLIPFEIPSNKNKEL